MTQKPLKIGYLMQDTMPDFNSNDGAKRHVVEVVHRLRTRGHQVRIVGVRDRNIFWTDSFEDWKPPVLGLSNSHIFRLFESGIRRTQRELHLPYLDLFNSFRFSDACCQALQGYDLLYTRYGFNGWGNAIASQRLGIPLMLEVNNDVLEEVFTLGLQPDQLSLWLIKNIIQFVYNKASKVIFVSEGVRDSVMRHWKVKPEKGIVIHNGTDLELLSSEFDQREIRQHYGVNEGPTVGFIGNFAPWYAIDRLVESVSRARSDVPDVQLILVGDGDLLPEIYRQVESSGLGDAVILTGSVDYGEVARLLSIMDITVIPNQKAEDIPTSLKLLDYMAGGKAIVISGSKGDYQVLKHGVDGWLIEETDTKLLADALIKLLLDPGLRNYLGKNARQKAIQNYSWDRTVEKIEAVCYSLINSGVNN